jgi:hypothetical protein
MSEYEKQLEEANEALQRKIDELESRLSWEEKTKDLRVLAAEYHKMWGGEIYSTNKDKLVNSILSIDCNSIISMWKNGYRISTHIKKVDSYGLFEQTKYAVDIVGPYSSDNVLHDRDKFFGIEIAVYRSRFHPLVSDRCCLIMEHNRVCDFSGAIAESIHTLDRSNSKGIMNLMERVDICKRAMNGKLLIQDCYIKLDTWKHPWTAIPGITP